MTGRGENSYRRFPVRGRAKVTMMTREDRLRARGFVLFDVPMTTDHTVRTGAVTIRRTEYLTRLRTASALTGGTLRVARLRPHGTESMPRGCGPAF